MDTYIKGIAVFNTKGDKRFVPLYRGLNIVSGNSQTGKSALINIIDWCLFADRCSVPKGKIYDFASFYAIIISIKQKTYLIARESPQINKSHIAIQELTVSYDIEDLSLNEIKSSSTYNINEGLNYINNIIEPNHINASLFDKISLQTKLNIRDSFPYIFLQQDIISSKKNLFNTNPKKTGFPVLAGWFPLEYYELLSIKKNVTSRLEKSKKEKSIVENNNTLLETNLRTSLYSYYSSINKQFNTNMTFEEILACTHNLEDFKLEIYDDKLQIRQDEIIKERDLLKQDIESLEEKISLLNHQTNAGSEYGEMIKRYCLQSEACNTNIDNTCPICNQKVPKLSEHAIDINNAKKTLYEELQKIPKVISPINTSKESLYKQLKQLKDKDKSLYLEYKQNESLITKIISGKAINDIRQQAKNNVIAYSDFYNKNKREFNYKEFYEDESRLDLTNERLSTFDVNERYPIEQKKIEDRMNIIANNIDYEHKPANLKFYINPTHPDAFKLFQITEKREKIYLSEMGSAANALACHLSLYLSLLLYFCKNNSSIVPSILFLDQPSQVYFQNGKDNTDITNVICIYETLLKEIEFIEKESSIKPQIIVADHIRDFGENNSNNYEQFFVVDWRDGKALI